MNPRTYFAGTALVVIATKIWTPALKLALICVGIYLMLPLRGWQRPSAALVAGSLLCALLLWIGEVTVPAILYIGGTPDYTEP